MSDFYPYNKKNREIKRPVSQKIVSQKVKFDFRDDLSKKEKIERFAKATGTTFSDLMRKATDNLIEAINESEIEDIR